MTTEPHATAAGVRVIAHEVLGSTNAEALKLAREGERGPFWVTAERQTAGRGRRGRTWISNAGNLYATLLLPDPAPVRHWPQLSFVAALAAHDAIVDLAAQLKPKLAIKWPNDLLLGGRKFAGILIEGDTSKVPAVAVGIGINCASHPANTDHPATDLATAGVATSPTAVFRAIAARMPGRLGQWDRGQGFAAIRSDWLALAAGIGHEVCVRLADHDVWGRFEGIDEAGGLLLRLPDGTMKTVAAGDVVAATSVVSQPDELTG
jgi:BirA family biotin operon repressor/biotin-[acetyl-CoA-carboxylase] ligase